ncbi:Switch-associated protein 70 [Heterocephalus glaber]|uniref:Switch-associated protein 70 n=1 Tax=Heterocephalus glaber TaxID=10181 RepID=G5C4N5_HETGA|nr:Switch-associated protein 70 [Heterocephalus glaber]
MGTAIHSTVHLLRLGSPPPHKEARQRRKELRKKLLAEQEELERQMKELQAANENKQQELETVRKVGVGGKNPKFRLVFLYICIYTMEYWREMALTSPDIMRSFLQSFCNHMPGCAVSLALVSNQTVSRFTWQSH